MNPQQKKLIRELVQKYSESIGTESLISFVAETNGMLAACKTLLQSIETGEYLITDWLFRDCLKYNVVFNSFLQEIKRLIALFNPSQENEDHFTTLSITPGAGRDEIKRAYRTLSLQCHPDTASPKHHDKPEKFIEINRAYHALLTAQTSDDCDEKSIPNNQWRKDKARSFPIGPKKKLFMWASAALVILAIVLTIASINIKNRAMLSGLQRGRTVSVVSADAVPKSIQSEVVTNNSNEPQTAVEQKVLRPPSPPKKTLPTIQAEQISLVEQIPSDQIPEQPSTKPVTITNNSRLNNVQQIPIETESPDGIGTLDTVPKVAKKSLENKQPFVPLTKQHPKSKSIPTETLPVEKETKIISMPRNLNNQVVAPTAVSETLPVNSAKTMKLSQVQHEIQSRINIFLDDYINAYQQRNLILFSKFFEADAIENGKPFIIMLPTYLELFAATSHLSLKVEKTSWEQLEGKIAVQGRFKLYVQYNDSRELSGTGPIRFVLMDNNGNLTVSILEYDFFAEK